jgi:uncharacterized protein
MKLQSAKTFILDKLRNELPVNLTYHGLAHTLDVYQSVTEIGQQEGITRRDLTLLQTAALFHDAGFIHTYQGHEVVGCEIAREHLPDFGYQPGDIEEICGMIMATQVPQNPQNHLQQIMCDADLNYLGRDDFFPVGRNLYKEFLEQQVVEDEESWNRLQVRFLENHRYFTRTAKDERADRKAIHLDQLRRLVASYGQTG